MPTATTTAIRWSSGSGTSEGRTESRTRGSCRRSICTRPPLRRGLLDLHVDNPAGIPRMQDKLLGARIDDVELDGSEESILRGIEDLVASKDPDILMTDGGDAFVMPYLARKAAELGVEMRLGRDPDKFE